MQAPRYKATRKYIHYTQAVFFSFTSSLRNHEKFVLIFQSSIVLSDELYLFEVINEGEQR